MKKRQVIMTTLAAAMVAPTVAGTAVTVNAMTADEEKGNIEQLMLMENMHDSDESEFILKDLTTGESKDVSTQTKMLNLKDLVVGHKYSISPKNESKVINKAMLFDGRITDFESLTFIKNKFGEFSFSTDGTESGIVLALDIEEKPVVTEEKGSIQQLMLMENGAITTETEFVLKDLTTGESKDILAQMSMFLNLDDLVVGHKYSISPKENSKVINKAIVSKDNKDKKVDIDNFTFLKTENGNFFFYTDGTENYLLHTLIIEEKKDSTVETPEDKDDTDSDIKLEQLKINVTINDKPITEVEDVIISFIKWDRNIPNTLYKTVVDKNGQKTFGDFEPNSKYEIRLGGSKIKFDKDFIRFTTDKDGKINTIDGKKIDKDFNGVIDFKSHDKKATDTKTFPVTIKAVFEDGTPAEGVTFTANTTTPRLASYRNTTTGKDGYATVELEGQEGGRVYSFCVAKNAQFMWMGNPGSIEVIIDENGNKTINNIKPNKYGETVFIVTKEDRTHYKTEFNELLKKSEELYASDKYTDESKVALEDAIGNAKAEAAKEETTPDYMRTCINLMNEAIKGLKEKTVLDSITAKVVKDGKPMAESDSSYVDLIQWDRFGIPNTLERERTDKDGEVTFKNLDPNSSYEIRMGNRNVKFDRDFISFRTDKDGKICKIDGKDIEKDSTGLVTFNALDKSDTSTKTFPIRVRAVFEDGTPAEGVTFTANTLTPRMASYRNGVTDKDGYATVELEGQEGGRDYSFCVAKNAQFMWQGNPGSIEFTVDENGNVSVNNRKPNKFGNTTFIVRKEDQRHLYTEFKETLKEAEEKYASDKYTDESKKRLGIVLDGARDEDAKPETIPQYVKGYTDSLKNAMKDLVEKNSGHSGGRRSSRNSSSNTSVNTPAEKKDEVTKKEINEKITYDRVAGSNRVATSVSVSKKYYKKADTVILANAANYADALAASSFASAVKAPILLVDNSQLNGDITSEIERLGAKNVVIVGGNNSISDNVKKNLEGKNVERVAGANRFETSQKLAEKAMENGYKDSMIVVDGKNFPDALSASSLLKKHKGAVLLVDESASGLKNVEFAKQKHLGKNIIIGGEGSVSKNIEGKLDSTKRIAGKDRYETSRKIAEEVLEKNNNIFVATGNGFADALTVGPVLSQNNASLVLVNKGNDNLAGLKNKFEPNSITAIGGINSIAESVMNNLKK